MIDSLKLKVAIERVGSGQDCDAQRQVPNRGTQYRFVGGAKKQDRCSDTERKIPQWISQRDGFFKRSTAQRGDSRPENEIPGDSEKREHGSGRIEQQAYLSSDRTAAVRDQKGQANPTERIDRQVKVIINGRIGKLRSGIDRFIDGPDPLSDSVH